MMRVIARPDEFRTKIREKLSILFTETDISSTSTFQRVVQKAVMRSASSETNWLLWIREGRKQRSCNQLDAAFSKSDARESSTTGHVYF